MFEKLCYNFLDFSLETFKRKISFVLAICKQFTVVLLFGSENVNCLNKKLMFGIFIGVDDQMIVLEMSCDGGCLNVRESKG
jgi:hypothetical protein